MSVTNLRDQMNGPTVRLSLRPHAHTDNGSDWSSSHSQSPALLHPHLGCTRAHSIIVRQKYVTEKLHMCMKKTYILFVKHMKMQEIILIS